MKYILMTLTAITLMTGAASAGQDIRKWHCVDLKANWTNAPRLQCPQLFIDERVQPQASPEIPAPPPPPEVVVEFVD
jgi:hypothetical protein